MDELTINVPAVYMARDVMILMGANPFRGPNDDFDDFDVFLSLSHSLQPSPAPFQRDSV
jgi:hypothetical protein